MQRKLQLKNGMEGYTATDRWGYVVCFGTIITFVAGIGHVNSFGLIYNEFIEVTHATSKSLTTAHGVFAVMLAVGGLLLNIQKERFSLQTGGLIGAVIFILGSFATIPITSTNQLPFTFGLLQGLGFGMMVPVCYATLNYYFIRRRTTVMSICKAVQGVMQIFYPQFVKQMMSLYGFRGTLLLISGISLHTIAGMATMSIIKDTEKKAANTADCVRHGNEDLLTIEKIASKSDETNEKGGKKAKSWSILKIFNVKVVSDPVFLNICVGQSFVNFSDLTFFMLQPMLLFQYGFDEYQVAYCISIGACADVAGRCALALLSSLVPVNTRLLYYVATFFTLLVRIVKFRTERAMTAPTDFLGFVIILIVHLSVRQFAWVAATTGAMGLLRSLLHVASPLVIAGHVTHEGFPGAYAMSMLAAGLINLAFGPLIGLLKDVYEDYEPAFYALSLCCVPCLLFWPVEYALYNK